MHEQHQQQQTEFSMFSTYANEILTGQSPMSVLLNGHTTFLMTDKSKRNNIKTYRMDWFVTNYTNYENVDKTAYYDYYQKHINDSYSGIFDPPPCFYNEMIREERRQKELEQNEFDEYYNDDIAMHYREIANRHLTRWDMLKEDSECMSLFEESETGDIDNAYDSYMSDYDDYDDQYYEDTQTEYEDDDYDY